MFWAYLNVPTAKELDKLRFQNRQTELLIHVLLKATSTSFYSGSICLIFSKLHMY